MLGQKWVKNLCGCQEFGGHKLHIKIEGFKLSEENQRNCVSAQAEMGQEWIVWKRYLIGIRE